MAFFKQNFVFRFSLLSLHPPYGMYLFVLYLHPTPTTSPLSTPRFAAFLSSFILFTYITTIKSYDQHGREHAIFSLSHFI